MAALDPNPTLDPLGGYKPAELRFPRRYRLPGRHSAGRQTFTLGWHMGEL